MHDHETNPNDSPPQDDGPPVEHASADSVSLIAPMDTTALAAVVRTEVDAGLVWAKANAREISKFNDDLRTFALRDVATAEKMFYSLRRGGKAIVGPSVRLAELAAECYGNLRAASRIISTTGEYAIAEGVAHDLERNVALSRMVARRLLDSRGRRYNDDMVVMTANAAGSLALRNAIVSVVGRRYLDPIVEEARRVVGGDSAGLGPRRVEYVKKWTDKGVSLSRILATLNRRSIEDVTVEDLADLQGIGRAIADGESTIDEAFLPALSLVEKVRARTAPKVATTAPEAAEGPADVAWSTLAANSPIRVICATMVEEIEAGAKPRMGLAEKRTGITKPLDQLNASQLSTYYELWKTIRLSGETDSGPTR